MPFRGLLRTIKHCKHRFLAVVEQPAFHCLHIGPSYPRSTPLTYIGSDSARPQATLYLFLSYSHSQHKKGIKTTMSCLWCGESPCQPKACTVSLHLCYPGLAGGAAPCSINSPLRPGAQGGSRALGRGKHKQL